MDDGSAAEGFLSRHAPGVPLPAGLQPQSLTFLARLAGASAARDEADRQAALAARRRAEEHASELEEVEDSLRQCGLTPGGQPPDRRLWLAACDPAPGRPYMTFNSRNGTA